MSAIIVLLISAITFSSCKKNDVDGYGSANLKVVNAAPNSGPQNFYLVNNIIVSDGLDFTETSNYISTVSGNRLEAHFSNEGANITYASSELYLSNGDNFTVYLVGNNQSVRIKQYKDDLSSPSAGKAKVKFIHLSDGAPSDIKIKNSNGNNLVSNLSRNIESGYINVDPGTLSLQIISTATGNNLGSFNIHSLTAGKVYTIYLTGDSSTDLKLNKIEY